MFSIDTAVKKLTVDEKISLLSGKDFWRLKSFPHLGITEIMVADGPHGLRKECKKNEDDIFGFSKPATCFPTAVTLASSWDRDLLKEVGTALAEECLSENISVLLGPGINIKRNPLCGRNFE